MIIIIIIIIIIDLTREVVEALRSCSEGVDQN